MEKTEHVWARMIYLRLLVDSGTSGKAFGFGIWWCELSHVLNSQRRLAPINGHLVLWVKEVNVATYLALVSALETGMCYLVWNGLLIPCWYFTNKDL